VSHKKIIIKRTTKKKTIQKVLNNNAQLLISMIAINRIGIALKQTMN
jgi:hypothetical protein